MKRYLIHVYGLVQFRQKLRLVSKNKLIFAVKDGESQNFLNIYTS